MSSALGFNEKMVGRLSDVELAGLPEATIVAIVQTWALLRKEGVHEDEIFSRIDARRSGGAGATMLPEALTLESYVRYRLQREHTTGAALAQGVVDKAIRIAKEAYSVEQSSEGAPIPEPLPFSPDLPDVTKCQPVRAYKLGQYIALVVRDPKAFGDTQGIGTGLVEYVYAMSVASLAPPRRPVLMVTAERSGPGLRAMLRESTGLKQTTAPFLCVFDSSGAHSNLGSSADLVDLEVFSSRALQVARDHLRIADEPVRLQKGAYS